MTEDKCFYYSKFVIIIGGKDRAKSVLYAECRLSEKLTFILEFQ